MGAVNKRIELLEPLFLKIKASLHDKTLEKLKHEISNLLQEYDLTHYDVEQFFNEQLARYEYKVTRFGPEACEKFIKLSAHDGLVDNALDSLAEIHFLDPRLFYGLVRKIFRFSRTKLLLLEFYDLTLLYASYRTNKYNRAYVLSQPYFREVDESVEAYFQATFEDVQFAFFKLKNDLEYVDEVLIQQVDLALENENYSKAFIPLAKALCINKNLFAIKRTQIEFVRRLEV